MARCPSCGVEANEGRYCGYCGAKVPGESGILEAAEDQPQEVAGWTCDQCGADNDVDGRFCHACGGLAPSATSSAAFAAPPDAASWTCANCGAVDEDDSDFCYACGSKRPISRAIDADIGAATAVSTTKPAVGLAPGIPTQDAGGRSQRRRQRQHRLLQTCPPCALQAALRGFFG